MVLNLKYPVFQIKKIIVSAAAGGWKRRAFIWFEHALHFCLCSFLGTAY